MNDWSETTVQLPALSRQLEEHLHRKRYREAEKLLDSMLDTLFDLKRWCIAIRSGEGTV